ncbi:metalloregulator ArsR/SmtB family transcription factor [Massilia sp. CCM 8695]|uniref:Metalloregulator ArsR/SmtB family transcription factor n=1 Tax=Massilia frigida TaxID=2609281 RepID=A0ABX0N2S6_9BURK|nr:MULTISPECIES: metalloregulator ArsR/SmtB family transcription factor [Massilia]MDM5176554.1 metalloregulator ArsR/SmtB family transcription factor [Massilia sp. DJPM01]NHZ79569.1 metalloregulator ArsR/SmtB family transcription factor [Massilia frigida]
MPKPDNPFDLARFTEGADKACALLKVLVNRDRLLLLCQLSHHERNVGELEQLTGIRQPTLSQQLTVLRNEQLVSTRRAGKQIFYSLSSAQATAVMDVLYQQFCSPTPEQHDDAITPR